jgi:hypothetical protein
VQLPLPDRVEVTLKLSLSRELFAAVAARAVRERKSLHQVVSELLAAETERRR